MVRGSARQAAIASFVNQTVKLPPLAQGRVVSGRVGDPVFPLRGVVTVVLVQHERQWRIQSSMEGQTSYADPPGKATSCLHATRSLYLPRHLGDSEAGDGNPDLLPAAAAKSGEAVLVVDDEPVVRMLVGDVLRDLGYDVIEAADGAEGLHVLRSKQRVDLLVSDVGLPGGMNGRQLADAARVCRPELKVLFITGYAENAALGHGLLSPGMEVLTKPFALDVLTAKVRAMI